jgi:hypothetical protein
LASGFEVHRSLNFGVFFVASSRRGAVGLVVDDHHEALTCRVVASGAGVAGAAEPVVRSVEEPLEHHRVWYAGEVSLWIPIRGCGGQLAGRAMV